MPKKRWEMICSFSHSIFSFLPQMRRREVNRRGEEQKQILQGLAAHRWNVFPVIAVFDEEVSCSCRDIM
jgi:hypothetical protein